MLHKFCKHTCNILYIFGIVQNSWGGSIALASFFEQEGITSAVIGDEVITELTAESQEIQPSGNSIFKGLGLFQSAIVKAT